jgi:6-phosphogluconolactonase
MNIKLVDTDELSEAVAQFVFNFILSSEKENTTIALSGGSTPKEAYAVLGEMLKNSESKQNITFIQVDERWVESTNDRSNQKMINETLFKSLKAANFKFIPFLVSDTAKSSKQSIDTYNKYLDSIGNKIDLMIMGVGEDGHTASLFPYNDDFVKSYHSKSVEVIYTFVESQNEYRLSLSPYIIQNANQILLVYTGEKKAKILTDALLSDDQQKYPVKLLQNMKTTIITDTDLKL